MLHVLFWVLHLNTNASQQQVIFLAMTKAADFSYPNHLFWTDYFNQSEVLHKTSEKQK